MYVIIEIEQMLNLLHSLLSYIVHCILYTKAGILKLLYMYFCAFRVIHVHVCPHGHALQAYLLH